MISRIKANERGLLKKERIMRESRYRYYKVSDDTFNHYCIIPVDTGIREEDVFRTLEAAKNHIKKELNRHIKSLTDRKKELDKETVKQFEKRWCCHLALKGKSK